MDGAEDVFDEATARGYEAWFETPAGRRADRPETALLSDLLARLSPPGVLLEVGCGTGHFARAFAARGWHVVGLERSPAMLAVAQERGQAAWVRGDAVALPFAEAAFDVAVFVTTLEFLAEPRPALREAIRVARRGLLLGVLNRRSPTALWRRVRGWFRPSVYRAARFYTVGELATLTRAAAGSRWAEFTWQATLFPPGTLWVGSALAAPLPGGAFLGVAVWLYAPDEGEEPPCPA
jgi:SAM-dependent methyltransferase